jgi:hypothetical protein
MMHHHILENAEARDDDDATIQHLDTADTASDLPDESVRPLVDQKALAGQELPSPGARTAAKAVRAVVR